MRMFLYSLFYPIDLFVILVLIIIDLGIWQSKVFSTFFLSKRPLINLDTVHITEANNQLLGGGNC